MPVDDKHTRVYASIISCLRQVCCPTLLVAAHPANRVWTIPPDEKHCKNNLRVDNDPQVILAGVRRLSSRHVTRAKPSEKTCRYAAAPFSPLLRPTLLVLLRWTHERLLAEIVRVP